MAFINKNDFSIVHLIQDKQSEDNYFECDELIAPAISLLNKKGYKTTFCCSGHPFGHICCAIMEEDPSEQIPEELLIRSESSNCVFDEWKESGAEFSTEEFPYHAVYREILASNLYVAFKGVYEFPDFPKDMNIKHFVDYQWSTIYHNFNEFHEASDTFEGVTRVYEINKAFYEWVEQLPDLKEK